MARLQPVRSDQVSHERTRQVLASLEELGKDVHMAHLFANATNVFQPYVAMSNGLLNKASLSPRLRELAILRLARHLDAGYEWWEHHRMSQQDGVTIDELDALEVDDVDSVPFGEAERLVLRICDEWFRSGWRLEDATWAEAERVLGPKELIDLVFVMAWWGAWVPSVVRALRIEVPTEGSEAS
jgi:alkylhydroperoxidase family enzyme